MTKWQIVFSRTGEKELEKLSRQSQSLIRNFLYTRILELNHPKQSGKSLSANKKGYWRYRVDKFRIICKLEEDKLVILIVKIAKRDVVYED
jgi:mRNA interferase RelE/StbE